MSKGLDKQPKSIGTNVAMASAQVSPFLLRVQDDEDLCCCEYINIKGERSHLLGLCCDCETLDDSFERLIQREELPESRVREICTVIQDRLRIPWCGGARRVTLTSVLPLALLPLLGYLSTLGPLMTTVSFLITPVLVRIVSKYVGKRRTTFYYSWTASTLAYCFLVVFYVMDETSWFVYTFNTILFAGILLGIAVTKRKGRRDRLLVPDNLPNYYYCVRCDFYIDGRDHHCNWLDCCVGLKNHYWFILTISSAILWVLGIIYSYLTFLTKYGFSTETIYENFSTAISFSTAIYGAIILLFLVAILAHHINMAWKGVSYLDWKAGKIGR